MSILALGWQVGLMLGCGIGGLLAQENWTELFVSFPYLLPMLVIGVLVVFDVSGIYF